MPININPTNITPLRPKIGSTPPELLLPAGDLEKLTTALLFGGDAVYVGGQEFSLRAYADNFDLSTLAQGIRLAHQMGKKVYVTVNILAHNRHMQALPPFLEKLGELGADGLIISDPGVMKLAARIVPQVPVTVSTQANVSNYESAALFRDWGAKRIVLARELSLEEITDIKSRVEVEIEVFVHGAMCVSYSGRCLLSYYMTGRSANQGACAHPCRYSYALQEEKRPGQFFPIEEDQHGTYILNSRDLCLLDYIPQLIEAGVDAFKVEGRMKSPLYAAVTGWVYRQAIDCWLENGEPYPPEKLEIWQRELQGIAARPYTDGFVMGPAPELQDINKNVLNDYHLEFCGVVKGWDGQTGRLEIEQRANFGPGDQLELMTPLQGLIAFDCREIYDENGRLLDRARHARQRVWVPWPGQIEPYSILRRVSRRTF